MENATSRPEDSEGMRFNHLAGEKSPYLMLHRDNPVDWYPWGEEAFARAREEDKPVFLSIGYSTCHWCHVMARESFMDEEVAKELNQNYVAVKVDREERPDIDHVYMNVCHLLTGSGGWPLTVIMTPDKRPFFAGTYFPKEKRFGLPGLLNILRFVSSAWKDQRSHLLEQADKVYKALTAGEEGVEGEGLENTGEREEISYVEVVNKGYQDFLETFDDRNGGFGTAPKFPSAHNLLFLIRYWRNTGRRKALEMAEKTLCHAYAGGIYDHIGAGFFRYSTDARWMIPHFEKMLYDNAMLLMAYTEMYQATQKEVYANIAKEIVSFLSRYMLAENGGFYSAIDAESEGEEGKYYLFSPQEIEDALGRDDRIAAEKVFGIGKLGKFEDKWVPNRLAALESREDSPVPSIEPLDPTEQRLKRRLLEYRLKRVAPRVDDKILTSWNALTAAALAKAGRALDRKDWIEMAEDCVKLINETLVKDGVLYTRLRDGQVAFPAYLDDYAFLIWALIELHQSTLETGYLELAQEYCRRMVGLFWDQEKRAFYLSAKDGEDLIVRPREVFDGALPSGNSVAINDLMRLAHLVGNEEWEQLAFAAVDPMLSEISRNPTGYGHLLSAIMYGSKTALDITVVGNKNSPSLLPMLSYLHRVYLPDALIRHDGDEVLDGRVGDVRPHLVICENRTCGEPITGIDMLQRAILRRFNKNGPLNG